MKNHKNVFGELEFELGDFFVPHRKGGTGKYCIMKHEPWFVTDAYTVTAGILIDRCPLFDSWIQAVKYLKENYADLL